MVRNTESSPIARSVLKTPSTSHCSSDRTIACRASVSVSSASNAASSSEPTMAKIARSTDWMVSPMMPTIDAASRAADATVSNTTVNSTPRRISAFLKMNWMVSSSARRMLAEIGDEEGDGADGHRDQHDDAVDQARGAVEEGVDAVQDRHPALAGFGERRLRRFRRRLGAAGRHLEQRGHVAHQAADAVDRGGQALARLRLCFGRRLGIVLVRFGLCPDADPVDDLADVGDDAFKPLDHFRQAVPADRPADHAADQIAEEVADAAEQGLDEAAETVARRQIVDVDDVNQQRAVEHRRLAEFCAIGKGAGELEAAM